MNKRFASGNSTHRLLFEGVKAKYSSVYEGEAESKKCIFLKYGRKRVCLFMLQREREDGEWCVKNLELKIKRK